MLEFGLNVILQAETTVQKNCMSALPSRATLDEILSSFDSDIKFGDFSTSIPPISLRYHQIIELLHGNLQYLSFISLWGFFSKR